MNFSLSINEALKIQAEQLKHYSDSLKKFVEGEARSATLYKTIYARTDFPTDDLDKQRNITEINQMIPRGGEIEEEFYKLIC